MADTVYTVIVSMPDHHDHHPFCGAVTRTHDDAVTAAKQLARQYATEGADISDPTISVGGWDETFVELEESQYYCVVQDVEIASS